MHLECPDYEAIGAVFAGTPFVIVGNNRDVAWGDTATEADVQDLYILKDVTSTTYSLNDNQQQPFDLRRDNHSRLCGPQQCTFLPDTVMISP